MKTTVSLIPAPTATQPGGYIPKAYADRSAAVTPKADLNVEAVGNGWKITLSWSCAQAVKDISKETDKFLDACALLVPVVADAPWISMGEPGKGVEGILWRADRAQVWQMKAEGLGTMERGTAPKDWKVSGQWINGQWQVIFELPEWALLSQHKQLAFAIWQGSGQERAGLKSLSPGWISVA